MMTGSDCPCGSGATYADCCGPYHAGAEPATCELLMRARYAAFVAKDAAFLIRTSHPSQRRTTRPMDFTASFALDWQRLEVLSACGGPDDATGMVHFRAHFRTPDGQVAVHDERSRFARERDGSWYYRDANG